MTEPYHILPAGREGQPASSTGPSGSGKRQPNPPRIRRRNRQITSCLECRRRKLGCDKTQPCANCQRFSRECVYLAVLDAAAQQKLAEIKEQMGSLERVLEDDVARRVGGSVDAGPGDDFDSGDDLSAPEDELDLGADPLAIVDAAYHDDANDDLVDLGAKLGKMRITERIEGFVRPRLPEEISRILGSSENDPSVGGSLNSPGQSIDDVFGPGSDYIAPASSFFFAPDPRKQSVLHFLPAKGTADKLVAHYWEAVHVVAHVLHRHIFERQYDAFWADITIGSEPRSSFQAIVLAIMLSSAVSLSENEVLVQYGATKQQLIDNFRQGTEAALSRANFLRTTKLETLQALVIYLIPLCRSEVSRAHSALTATAIRLAECMGLHRDGTHYGLAPVDVHVRRLVWYHLCVLDIRTCEATGPRPCIRKDEYDTKLPLNVDDADFESGAPPTQDANHFTDMTITRIRFECNEMHRMIWIERPRVERKKNTLTNLLSVVESFRTEIEKKYFPMFNSSIPLHYMAALVYGILSKRMHISILHRYSSNQQRLMPERLRRILLFSGTLVLEHAIDMDTSPAIKTWSWVGGALQQYHAALILLDEMYAKQPQEAEEARIWHCLDYVFEIPSHLTPFDKVRYVYTQLRERTEAYQNLRKMRAPTRMLLATPDYRAFPSDMQHGIRRSPSIHSAQGSMIPPEYGYQGVEGQLLVPPIMTPRRGSDASAIAGGSSPSGEMAENINWNELERIYPPEVTSSHFEIPRFSFPEYSHDMRW